MLDSQVPGLFVLAGLVGAGELATAAPTPAPEIAQLQLRAVNHRVIPAGSGTGGALIEALTHSDFVATRSDGAWLSRADFIAHVRGRTPVEGATVLDEPVRLFGPVALVHGVYSSAASRVRYTDVYLWGGPGWRLVSTQDTPLREGVSPALVAGLAPACSVWRGQDPTGADAAVLTALNERYVKSFRDADVAWYDTHLAPDYVVISSDGSYQDRAAALAHFALPTFADSMTCFPVERVQVRQFGDVALIHATNIYEMKDGRTGESRYTDIWHRQGARWRCIAAHITAHKMPGPPR